MTRAWVIALAFLVAGCAGARDVAAPPNPPKPPLQGPPPAWVETSMGARWLGFSTYCWRAAGCADYELARCTGLHHAPVIEVRKGEKLRFHLGFEPKKVLVHVYTGALEDRPELETLAPSRTPTWRAKRAEPLLLTALPKSGGDTSYAACIHITPAP